MEANWMKSIPNSSICNFFYFFFVFYAAIALITLLGTVGILSMLNMPKAYIIASGFQSLLVFALAATAALFHYLICDRALLATAPVNKEQGMNRPVMY